MSAFLITVMVFLPMAAVGVPADDIDDAIASLEKAIKEKGKADIKHFVSLLGEKFTTAKPEQQKEILRLDGIVLNQSDQELKDAAVEAVGKTADARGVPLLTKELDKKTTEDNAVYFAACVKSLGKLKDPKAGLDRLMKLLKHKSIDAVAVAADALGNYKEAPFETRKSIVDDLLKIYGSIHSAANNPRDSTAKAKLAKLQPAADETLKNLTGQQFKSHPEWLKWWNDTGKKATKW